MSDLDNEEYEATKKLQEKTADEMFESLGYKKAQNDAYIVYRYDLTPRYYKEIRFYKDDKEIITKLFFRHVKKRKLLKH